MYETAYRIVFSILFLGAFSDGIVRAESISPAVVKDYKDILNRDPDPADGAYHDTQKTITSCQPAPIQAAVDRV